MILEMSILEMSILPGSITIRTISSHPHSIMQCFLSALLSGGSRNCPIKIVMIEAEVSIQMRKNETMRKYC